MNDQFAGATRRNRTWTTLLVATALAVGVSLYFVFVLTPPEREMGAVQRIFYYHVASAFASYAGFFLVLIMSLGYLATRSIRYDLVMEAAGEVGFLFATICLGTGMIWGSAIWNTPFRLEPRLVSTLVLWLIFLAFNVLRWYGDPARVRVHSAVLGVLGALTVPVVVYSIELLPQYAQLHPKVMQQGGLKHPLYHWGLLMASVALLLLETLFIWFRFRIAVLQVRVIEGKATGNRAGYVREMV